MGIHNEGVFGAGQGDITFAGGNVAIGRNARVQEGAAPRTGRGGRAGSWNVGVITALSVEMREVAAMLQRIGRVDKRALDGGQRFHECRASIGCRPVTVVGTQTLSPGQRSAMAAFQRLRDGYSPAWVALVGIAGGIDPEIQLGDVVIAQEIVYYDMRKETARGVRRRGQSQPIPAAALHAVNDFFADHPKPCRLRGGASGRVGAGDFEVLAGPIGSGEAVVADRYARIRDYVRSYNDKTLALETEAGGVAQAFYEGVNDDAAAHGWLAIRGISDKADKDKDDAFHGIAARHAAKVLEELLPYLVIEDVM